VAGHLGCADLAAEFSQHLRGRSLDGIAADHGRNRDNRRGAFA
jgi:hypothetical protein